jgi:hypothetical protein
VAFNWYNELLEIDVEPSVTPAADRPEDEARADSPLTWT